MQQSTTQVVELVVNLDDVTGEVVGHAIDALLEAGALDVWTTAITMKRNRPGVMLSLLCRGDLQDALAKQMLQLTGSFGLRMRSWDRMVLHRHHVKVITPFGQMRIKVGSMDGRPVVTKCEYADAEAGAEQHGVPVRQVLAAANAAAQRWLAEQEGLDA